ncbi:MAG: hypothetical protein LN569_02790 [Rickettsia endosymbiont of Labidopullus appendiculatus]|nr:hypothetical protein [Rickettsia endosymbiont of Labidopullus appendiculatus]
MRNINILHNCLCEIMENGNIKVSNDYSSEWVEYEYEVKLTLQSDALFTLLHNKYSYKYLNPGSGTYDYVGLNPGVKLTIEIKESLVSLLIPSGGSVTLWVNTDTLPLKDYTLEELYIKNKNYYSLKASTSEELYIKNISSFINICTFLNKVFANFEKITFSDAMYFRTYEKMDKKLIALFAQQNKMSFTTKQVDSFIKDNFWELSGVAADLDSADTYKAPSPLPWEILKRICLYLKLSEVNYSHTIEEKNANDISSDTSTMNIALAGDNIENLVE